MIRKLKLRFTVLVWFILLVIMVGVVAAVNITERNRIFEQANTALETLCAQDGERPSIDPSKQDKRSPDSVQPENSPPPVDENGAGIGDSESSTTADVTEKDDTESQPGTKDSTAQSAVQDPGKQPDAQDQGKQPGPQDPGDPSQNAGQTSASLSNYYTVKLNHDGTIDSWNSDRLDLYTEDDVTAFVEQVASSGSVSGNIGSCFYRLENKPYGSLMVVLDMRLEMINFQSLLRSTILIGIICWALMCVGAFFLIRRLIRPVQEGFDRQQQFVWDASHELKTPLAVISANADALSRDIGENEWLGYIHDEIDRAARMINSMLTLAQIDQGVVRAQMKPFDLSHAMIGVILPFESVAFESGKTLVSDIPDTISYTGDESMITQLISILLSNAIKYADKNGTVTARLSCTGRHCVISVHNTGDGISPRDREHIFERFYRADSAHSSSVEGSGLGLAIAKSLVDAHHGHITVECPLEGGTVFTVTLP